MDPRIIQNALGKIKQAAQRIAPVAQNTANFVSDTVRNANPALKAFDSGTHLDFQKHLPTQIANRYLQSPIRQAATKVLVGSPFDVYSPRNDGLTQYQRTQDLAMNFTPAGVTKVTNPVTKLALNKVTQKAGEIMDGGNFIEKFKSFLPLGKTPQSTANEKLKNLLTYDDTLAKMGVTAKERSLMDVHRGMDYIKGFGDKFRIKPKQLLDDSTRQGFRDWVNGRRAIAAEQLIAKKNFEYLDNDGIDAFFNLQAGKKVMDDLGLDYTRYQPVRDYLNKLFKQVKEMGIDIGYQQDYLPQVWNNTDDEIAKVFGKRITTKPGFTLEKIIADYKTGIDAGLQPKFEKISDLMGWYQGRVSKAVSDRQFLNFLNKEQMILPSAQAPKDWVTLNPDRFPRLNYTSKGMEFRDEGPFKAPKQMAELINNYLYSPLEDGNAFQRTLAHIANYAGHVKNVALSFGIPYTGINAHGLNIMARHTLFGSGSNPVGRLFTSVRYMTDPWAAKKLLDKELQNAPTAVRNGLTLSTEDFKPFTDQIAKGGKFGRLWGEVFEKRLFDQMIPAMKISSYNQLAKQMDPKQAAIIVNNTFGGINTEQMGRNRDFQNFLRASILAPDWNESTVRLGGNLVKSLVSKGPVAARYRTMITNIAGAYITANIANYLSSGHGMWENDPGHTFEIEAGFTGDGSKRYIRPFGTAVDMVRLPFDLYIAATKGDLTAAGRIIRNRLSIPMGVASGYFSDVDYRGQAIGWRGKDKYGNEIPLDQRAVNIGTEVASLIGVPSFLKQAIKTAKGDQGLEEGVTQAFELPFRYSGGAFSKGAKSVEGIAKAGGLKGEDLYNVNEKTRGVTFSENQLEMLRQAGIDALDPLLQMKDMRSTQNKIRDVLEKSASGEISEEEADKQIEEIEKGVEVKTEAPTSVKSASAYAGSIIPSSEISGSTGESGVSTGVSNLKTKTAESLARMRVESTGQAQEANNKYFYLEDGDVKTLDFGQLSEEGKGLDKHIQKGKKLEIAKKIYAAEIPDEKKAEFYKKLGVSDVDAAYDFGAGQSIEVKSSYLAELSGKLSRDDFLTYLIKGRKESMSGDIFVANAVIDNLIDQGLLSKYEGSQLKKVKVDKQGQNKTGLGNGSRKPKKLSISIPSVPKGSVPKSRKIKLRRTKLPNNFLKLDSRSKGDKYVPTI